MNRGDEVFAKWLKGEPACQKRSHHPPHKYRTGRSFVYSPDGRLLLFSDPSKGDVVLGITTPTGQKLVVVHTMTSHMNRHTKALLAASNAVQALVSEDSKLSPWDARLGGHGTPLPSLVGTALEPPDGFWRTVT